MLVLDERHEVDVVVPADDEHSIARIAVRVVALEDVEKVAALNMENGVLESNAAARPEPVVLGVVPVEEAHARQATTTCA